MIHPIIFTLLECNKKNTLELTNVRPIPEQFTWKFRPCLLITIATTIGPGCSTMMKSASRSSFAPNSMVVKETEISLSNEVVKCGFWFTSLLNEGKMGWFLLFSGRIFGCRKNMNLFLSGRQYWLVSSPSDLWLNIYLILDDLLDKYGLEFKNWT